ncbi:hypothetical protein [Tenggerimyces flavus]|uniref:Uncharacterized protein n=1 Tax=Tenggerimyces flavus TaxID=1708749 RepID=A0ABV7YCF6_9ACTN|nr:hypothetical protein [Tenggerimyces flavus]MBM7791378.1 hypothetical protein [Tenggerimyces flavus]
MSSDVWVRDRDRPFGTLLSYCGTYLHPEVYYSGMRSLVYACNLPEDEQHPDTKQFLVELERVIVGDAEGLAEDALFKAAEYDDGSDEAFVTRVWTEIFPGKPLPTRDLGPGSD